jgi:hypothetical protein
MERNLCVESGCPALCCKDKWLVFLVGNVKDYFPDAIEASFQSIGDERAPGVYYTVIDKDKSLNLVRIQGTCPNVGPDFYCRIQERKPEACMQFVKDGRDCLDTINPKDESMMAFFKQLFKKYARNTSVR